MRTPADPQRVHDLITRIVNESVSWDDRKTLSEIYQRNGGRLELSDDTYSALIAVAEHGASEALRRAFEDQEETNS